MKHEKLPHPIALPGGLAASFVAMPDSEAVEIARRRFGIDGRATRLATEKDDTFRISGAAGSRFILKIANPCEDASEIDLQVKLLDHIATTAPELPVPRMIANDAGEQHFNHQDKAGQHRRVRMMSYLDGKPLSEVRSSASGREQVGRMLGQLRLATADFAHPADSRVLAWDVTHLRKLEGLLDQMTDPAQRKLLARALSRFVDVESRLANCRTQVLHNDFSKSNIVVDPALPAFVTGVIDFGDAVRTAIAVDVSTALLNQLPPFAEKDLFSDGRDLLRGYLTSADLTEEELRLVPHLVMARIVARTLLSTSLAKITPANATYLLRNTDQGWSQLDWFLSRSADEVSAVFERPIRSL